MFDFCIVGAGATGLSLLLLLQDAGIDPQRIAIVDPYFDGGDLTRRWTTVVSNTPWSKTLAALPAGIDPPSDLPLEATAPLAELGLLLQRRATPALRRAGAQIQGMATRASWNSATSTWSVEALAGGSVQRVEARRLVLAPGGEPRSMDLPIPSIPLEIALDRRRLPMYVKPGQRVLQFGTMHSGALVARNLVVDCSASVVAFYNTPEPFVWDRDGAYDGLKGEAADVADAICRGEIGGGGAIGLFNVAETSTLLRNSARADWVVYAMGFRPRTALEMVVDGKVVSPIPYDGASGALKEAPAAWGFGIAYPNRAPDGIHWDVSVAAFLNHMRKQLPALTE